jgi:AAA15 family ATPase/GTPase
MFKSVSVKNFRGIDNLELKNLAQINIFVGENGIGKSSILDAIFTGLNPNSAELIFRTNIFRNISFMDEDFWRTYFYNFDFNNLIEIELYNKNKSRKIAINPYYSEQKIFFNKKNQENISEEYLKNTPTQKRVFGLKLNFDNYISKIWEKTDGVEWKEDDNYNGAILGNYIGPNTTAGGKDSVKKFSDISESNNEDIIIKSIQSLNENIQDIEVHSSKGIIVKDKRFSRKVSLNTYGDGIVRAFNLLCFILGKDNGITLIDEIENGLHIESQKKIWQSLFQILDTNNNRQIFATTHSYEMVKKLHEVAKENKMENSVAVFRLQEDRNKKLIAVHYSPEELENAIGNNNEIR